MKMTLFISMLLLTVTIASANDIVGSWHGLLDVQGTKLRISFHITHQENEFKTLMDSPDQGAMGLPTTMTSYKDTKLVVTMKNLGAEFSGTYKDGKIDGIFAQAGMQIPLKLTRKDNEPVAQKSRPQDPVKPYNYHSEEVIFDNPLANNIQLAGTLTVPNNIKNPPVAIMITGSGPQNRDEEIKMFNHRPFLVWSDYLSQNGIAVLRFDDRGVGKSEGTHKDATSADFATDVEAAFSYLKSRSDVIDTNKIGLIGHSEGGFIAPMVAANNKEVAFIVLLAGTGVDGAEILTTQTIRAQEIAGMSPEIIDMNKNISEGMYKLVKKHQNLETLTAELKQFLMKMRDNHPQLLNNTLSDENIATQVSMVTSHWFLYFIRTNPQQFLSKIQKPILAINGELDFQVLPELNLKAIEKSLVKAQNKDYTIKMMNGLNHLFQSAETGSLAEYAQIEETVSPHALLFVTEWINSRFGI